LQEIDEALHIHNDTIDCFRFLLTNRLVRVKKLKNYSGCFGSEANNLICI